MRKVTEDDIKNDFNQLIDEGSILESILLEDISINIFKRYVLSSYDDIFYWIKKKFEIQEKYNKPKCIDLSDVVIKLYDETSNFENALTHYSDFRIDELVNHKDNRDIFTEVSKFIHEIKYPIKFDYSIIYSINFRSTLFCDEVSFEGTQFFGLTQFSGSIFSKRVYFLNTYINTSFKDTYKFGNIGGQASFDELIFKDTVSFSNLKWDDSTNVLFNNNTYEKAIKFRYCNIGGSYKDFTKSQFKGGVTFDGINGKEPYSDSITEINLNDSYFYGKLKIRGHKLGNIRLSNCHFNNTVNISFNRYDENTSLDFSYSTINSLFFIDSDLGNSKGESIDLHKSISFSKSLILEGAFVFLRNINKNTFAKGILDFTYSNIIGSVVIQDSNLEELNLNRATVVGNLNVENVETNYDCRESITKIKNEFIKRNDNINSLKYKAIELKKHKSELKSNRCFKNKMDLALLWLNTKSNDNGQDWVRGVCFTFFSWISFYSLYLIASRYNALCSFFSREDVEWTVQQDIINMFSYLWSIDFLAPLKELEDLQINVLMTIISIFIFIFGKIIVGYGIYQTISAFRKYGKN